MEQLKFKVGDCFFYKDETGIMSGKVTKLIADPKKRTVYEFQYTPIYFKVYRSYDKHMCFDKDSKLYKEAIVTNEKMVRLLWRE